MTVLSLSPPHLRSTATFVIEKFALLASTGYGVFCPPFPPLVRHTCESGRPGERHWRHLQQRGWQQQWGPARVPGSPAGAAGVAP